MDGLSKSGIGCAPGCSGSLLADHNTAGADRIACLKAGEDGPGNQTNAPSNLIDPIVHAGGTMETRSKGQSHLKIIDLTPDQEIPESEGGRIIDLSKTLDDNRTPPSLQPTPAESTAFPDSTPDTEARKARLLKQAQIDAEIDRAFGDTEPVEISAGSKPPPLERTEFPEPPAPERNVLPPDSEEIIDLEEMVLPETLRGPVLFDPAQEIIDLTDIIRSGAPRIEPPGAAMSSAAAADEIIDLIDVVTPASPADDSQDEIIDLIDVVLPGNRKEEIIDLVDIVQPAEMARANAQRASVDSESWMIENNLLPLDLLPPDEEDRLPEKQPTGQSTEHRGADVPKLDIASAESDDNSAIPVKTTGIELDQAQPQALVLPQETLEAAIEKILLTRYADRIERLIAIAVEKAVNREIEQIKGEFMDEVDLRGDEDEDPD